MSRAPGPSGEGVASARRPAAPDVLPRDADRAGSTGDPPEPRSGGAGPVSGGAGSAAGPGPGDPVQPAGARWRVLLSTSVCYLCYYTGRQNFGWAIPGLRRDLGLTNTHLGWVSGVGLGCYAAGQLVTGPAGDRLGGRLLVVWGAVLSCLLNWATSFGRGLWGVLLPWALNGVAQSMGYAPGTRLIADWWGAGERGFAFGVFNVAAGSSSLLTFATAMLVLTWFDWPWVFRLPVLLMPLGALVLYLGAREHPEGAGRPAPAACGPGRGGLSGRERSGAAAWGRPGPVPVTPAARPGLRGRRFALACLGFGFGNWARLGLLVWAPSHYLGAGSRAEAAGAVVTLTLPLGMALGALAAGLWADRLGPGGSAPLVARLALAAGAVLAGVALIPRDAALVGMLALGLSGFLLFGAIAVYTVMAAELAGGAAIATGVGIMNATGYVVAALGDPAIGFALDRTGRTETLFLVAAAACGLSAGCASMVARDGARARRTECSI